MTFWTEEKVELLRKLWAEGLSATMVGNQLGCTRNAVIGKIGRLGLSVPINKVPVIINKKVFREQKYNAYVESKSIFEVTGCRYPIDDKFCNCQICNDHPSYCTEHKLLCCA